MSSRYQIMAGEKKNGQLLAEVAPGRRHGSCFARKPAEYLENLEHAFADNPDEKGNGPVLVAIPKTGTVLPRS